MLNSVGLAYVRKRDFQISFDLGLNDPKITDELADAVRIVRTSRMHNMLLLEVGYPVDGMVHQTLEYLCLNGVLGFRWDLVDPNKRSLDATRPGHLSYVYEEGVVIDQYAVSSREEDADDPLLDVLQINFKRKHVTKRKWVSQAPAKLVLVEKPSLSAASTADDLVH